MASESQGFFDPDLLNIDLRDHITIFLTQFQLADLYHAEDIIDEAYCRCEEQLISESMIEIRLAWLKTTCLEIIKELSQQRDNKQQFNVAIQALFDIDNPDARSFWANITRTLRQFRLSGTYDVKEVIAEAYAIGIKRIESGTVIEKPLPWLRKTCFNVIRDLRRKQSKVDRPKLDCDGLTPGDEVFSDLILLEDRKAMRLALAELSPDDRALLCARVLEGKSWQEIGTSLHGSGDIQLNANAARQRGYRVLQKLRQRYAAIRLYVHIAEDELELQSD